MSQTDFIDLQRQLSGWKQSGKSKLEELKQDLSHAHSDRDEAKQKEVVGAIKELKKVSIFLNDLHDLEKLRL